MFSQHQAQRVEYLPHRLMELGLSGVLRPYADHYLFDVIRGSLHSRRCHHRRHCPTSFGTSLNETQFRSYCHFAASWFAVTVLTPGGDSVIFSFSFVMLCIKKRATAETL